MPRKTYVTIDGARTDLNSYYLSVNAENKPNWSNFCQRVKSQQKIKVLTDELLADAVSMSSADWITFYGGGRRKEFIYDGTDYPEHIGKKFKGRAVFLKIIGKYEKSENSVGYALIKSRLQRGWPVDSALKDMVVNEELGRIYVIKSTETDLAYVGETTLPLKTRFSYHLYGYKNEKQGKNTALKKALKEYGAESFGIYLLEDNVPSEKLVERENYWINKLGTRHPKGLNMIRAQRASRGQGKEIIYQGIRYSSMVVAVRTLKKEHPHLEEHVIEKCIRENRPLPLKQRRQSKHPEAGTNLHRRWKSLLRRGKLCTEWSCGDAGYDQFKADMGFPPEGNYKLYKKDASLPHSKENSEWITRQEAVERTSGKGIWVYGVYYPTHTAAARKYGIALSTFNARLDKGQSPEEAVSKQKKTTKAKPGSYDNKDFPSQTELCKYAAQKHGITFHQARDRRARGLSLTHSPKKGKPCTVRGIDFKSEKAAAEYFGVSLSTFAKQRGHIKYGIHCCQICPVKEKANKKSMICETKKCLRPRCPLLAGTHWTLTGGLGASRPQKKT